MYLSFSEYTVERSFGLSRWILGIEFFVEKTLSMLTDFVGEDWRVLTSV